MKNIESSMDVNHENSASIINQKK